MALDNDGSTKVHFLHLFPSEDEIPADPWKAAEFWKHQYEAMLQCHDVCAEQHADAIRTIARLREIIAGLARERGDAREEPPSSQMK